MSSPWAFHLHPVAWVVLLALTALYAAMIRRPAHRVSRRQAWSFLGAVVVLVVALTWPLADLAAHRLLLALVVQRLLLLLAAPPLLLAGAPPSLAARLTRVAAVDEVVGFLSRPVPAIALVTVVGVSTLTTPAVAAQASSPAVRAVVDAALLGAGLVLWLPVRSPVPGTEGLSALGKAGYLIAQSIVPSFLAVVWIFARHPLYAVYAHPARTLGMSPVLDQQLAGFTAKLSTIFVLWSVAFVVVHRSERDAEEGREPPLTWADVERQLERAERRARRRAALPLPPTWGDAPPSSPRRPGSPGDAGDPTRPSPGEPTEGGRAPA